MQLPAHIGKYELEQFLGGGMSHVYRARDTIIGRTVVVKILTEQGCADPEAKARFLQEARMSASIQHENIICIYDYGEEQGRPYMVMELLTGQDLKDAIRTGSTGDLQNKLCIALQIARALQYVHSKKIIHRDIKPENIHLDASGKVKLMDFGIAKAEGMSMTKAGFSLGTPYYMSPEQVLGEQVGEPADVYAFGILLFELLTGTKPITGDTVERLFYQILNEPLNLEPLRQAGTPEPICSLVARCTAKKQAERIQNFGLVIGELENLTRKVEPAASLDSTTGGRGEKTGSSGKLVVAVIVLVVAVIAGGLMWYNRPRAEASFPKTLQTDAGLMLLVPGGRFLHGANKETAIVPAFYIDRTEVTNAAYEKFCAATNRPLPKDFAPDRRDDPVVNVTIADATAFARWAGKRLPDALEWEKAVRGTTGQLYPWGDDPNPKRANVADNPDSPKRLMPADSMPEGASPFNAVHLAGNALEYVRNDITPSQEAVKHFSAILHPPPALNEPWYSVKGGSFTHPFGAVVPYEFSAVPARFSAPDIGFRCVKDPPR